METNSKTLGILGGGQLGMMSAQAAKKLGIKTVILTPEENSPASYEATETIIAAYDNQEKLEEFASKCDVISYEFENIPLKTVRYLKNLKPVYPDDILLEIAQDRIKEKTYLNAHNIPTARWAEIKNTQDIENILKLWKTQQCILKTTRFGYDGKGQVFIRNELEIIQAIDKLKDYTIIAEEVIDFDCEISVIVSRETKGEQIVYTPILNDHKNHILSKSTAPANLSPKLEKQATKIAINLANAVNLVGVLALEMFVTKDERILANEIAPRPHNSGHWTIDACEASQFENHVRSVCGLPLASPNQHSTAEMINLIGDDINNIAQYKNNPNAHIHLYHKKDVRKGRKMGHVTIIKPNKV